MRRSLSETDVEHKSIRGGEAPHRAERLERGGEGKSETADVCSSATRLFQSRTPNISLKQMDPLASTTFLNKQRAAVGGKKKRASLDRLPMQPVFLANCEQSRAASH